MLIYWGILIYTSIMGFITNIKSIKLKNGLHRENIVPKYLSYLTFLLLIFFIGMRTNVLDTSAYIGFFESLPSSIFELNSNTTYGFEKGFVIFSVLVKQFISSNSNVWLMIIALISGICVLIPLRKYSLNFGFSAFLFISTTSFSWMLNGMRQFICVTILFYFTNLILEKKTLKYIILVLILSTIHTSCLIAIPVYFIVQGYAWDKKNVFLAVIVVCILLFTSNFVSTLNQLLVGTTYEGITSQFNNDDGVSLIRVLVNSMPVIIAFVFRKRIEKIDSKVMNLCINMSFVSSMLYVVGSVTSGILVGRLPIYFSLYNIILLPNMIEYLIKPKQRIWIYILCGLLYILFFYYQMNIAWNGLIYESFPLGIKV